MDSDKCFEEEMDVGFAMTQALNESESQLDEKISQDTYCSTNSPVANLESSEDIVDQMASSSNTEGINLETNVDPEKKEKSSHKEDSLIDVDMEPNISAIEVCKKDVSDVHEDSNTSDADKTHSLVEEDEELQNTPKMKIVTSAGAASSPELFSEPMGPTELIELSSIEVTSTDTSLVTITDTSTNTSITGSSGKRKAEEKHENETHAKKPRPSCMIVYESTSQRKESIPMLDLTKEHSMEAITIPDEIQHDFSLRLDSQSNSSPSDEKNELQESMNTWKSHRNGSTENASERNTSWTPSVDKDNDLSWHSHKESSVEDFAAFKAKYDELLKEKSALQAKLDIMLEKEAQTVLPDASSSDKMSSIKESLYTFTETCLMCGVVMFTLNEATSQIVSAEVKQLSLLGQPGKDKKRPSLSSGNLADKSFSSGTSGDSRVSVPGPFTLPKNRLSLLSTASSSSSTNSVLSSASAYAKVIGMRNFDGPFLVPSAPLLKNMKDVINLPLSCSGQTLPAVKNIEDFLCSSDVVNRSPELHLGSVEEKISKFEALRAKNTAKVINKKQTKDAIAEENEEIETEGQEATTVVVPPLTRRKGRKKKSSKSGISTKATPSKTKLSTPAKAVKLAEPVEQTTVTEEEVQVKAEGKAVFAKWSDSQYYPGWTTDDMSASRIKVYFCDGNVDVLSSVKVIPADWLKAGRIALAQHRDKVDYSPCLIMNIEQGSGDGPVYVVDGDSSTNKVDFSQIALTETHAAEIREEAIATGRMSSHHLVSLDNVLNHPRTRTPRTPNQNITSKTPTSSRKNTKESGAGPSRNLIRSISTDDCQTVGSVDTSEDTDGNITSGSIHGNEVLSLDPECSPQEFPSDSKRKTSQRKQVKSTGKSQKILEEDLAMEQNFGPLPEEGSTIFTGCNFLLTYTLNKKTKYSGIQKQNTESSDCKESTGDEEWFHVKSFNKQRLRLQIKKGGGKLYQTLQQVPPNEYSNTYLITDQPSCTPLYLQCLVHGITIYNHKSIIDCCKEKQPFKQIETHYLLPAGWSLERTVYCNPKKNCKPFKKLKGKVLLSLNMNKASLQFWKKLLEAASAKVIVHKDKVTNLNTIAVIVADVGCSIDLIDVANQNSVPVVSLVWVQQCIIDGALRPFDGHPDYLFNHISEPESPEY